jgi:hypothetical protein
LQRCFLLFWLVAWLSSYGQRGSCKLLAALLFVIVADGLALGLQATGSGGILGRRTVFIRVSSCHSWLYRSTGLPQRSCWRFHLDRIAGALAQPTCSDCFSVSAKLMTAGGLSFRVSNYGSGVIL